MNGKGETVSVQIKDYLSRNLCHVQFLYYARSPFIEDARLHMKSYQLLLKNLF